MEWQRDLKDPTEFIETVKIDLFEDEVFVFTPKGDVKALPKGATPIDFAYADPLEGRRALLGRAGQRAHRSAALSAANGDTVEILTSANQKPSKDWLKFVVTSRARTQIRHFLRHGAARAQPALGRDLLAASCASEPLAADRRSARAGSSRRPSGCASGTADDLLVAVGYGKVNLGASRRRRSARAQASRAPARTRRRRRRRGTAGRAPAAVEAVGRRACASRARPTSW